MPFSSPMAAIAAGYSVNDYDPTEQVEPDYELLTKLSSPPPIYGNHFGSDRDQGGSINGFGTHDLTRPDATFMVKYFVV